VTEQRSWIIEGLDPERVPVEHIPAVLGEVEAYKAALWLRLVMPSSRAGAVDAQPSAPLLTVAQVAERLGVTKARVYELGRCGEVPSVRIGKLVRFRSADLDRYIESNQHGAARPTGRRAVRGI
jgi:excisionase family DNA binding protein